MDTTTPTGNKLTKKRTLAVPRTESTTDVWLTPKPIIDALGPFDLDPCHNGSRPFETATNYFTESEDGLKQEWRGRVFCNPPYGDQTGFWLDKLASHGNGIALVFAKTETDAFAIGWRRADAMLFLRRRIKFLLPDGTLPKPYLNDKGKWVKPGPGSASVLMAFGSENATVLESCGLEGWFVQGVRHVGGKPSLFESMEELANP